MHDHSLVSVMIRKIKTRQIWLLVFLRYCPLCLSRLIFLILHNPWSLHSQSWHDCCSTVPSYFLILHYPCSFPIMACFCSTVLYVSPALFYSSYITHDHSIPSHYMLWALLNMCSLSVIVLYFHFTREIKKENRRLSRINSDHCTT